MSAIQAIPSPLLCPGLNWLCRRRLATTGGSLRLPGLQGPVEIIRDRWGVPHIYADNTLDVLFGQGFAHAQDRLWQMDFQRRLASGRLAEVLGEAALPVDRWLRVIGMRRLAEAEVALLDPEVRATFDAYAAGVNAWISRGPLPIEFALLRYRPEPWTPADTLVWTKMMAWNLSVNWESEILRAQLIARLGPERAAELEPAYCDHWPCVVPQGADYTDIGHMAEEWVAEARPFVGPPAESGLGSNAWVIAGSRTASGRPILANDMHQLMGVPGIFYQNHLEGGDLHLWGGSFPGVLGIIAGHNRHVAWGMSNGFPDVQDLYIERLRHASDGRIQYQYEGEWHDAQVIRERIGIRGEKTAVEEVVITRHGPIINALAPDFIGEQPLALRWTSLEPETMGKAFHHMTRARNCREFHEALRHWTSPAQNIVSADTEGNICYSFPGRVPIRAKGRGVVPVPGWTGEYEWQGYVPFDELPHLDNPPQGYVASANNRVTDDDYPYHISCDYCSGDRAQRIGELIERGGRIDLPYVQQMQMDLVSPGARVIAAHLGRLEVEEPDLAAVVEFMGHWDGRLTADSPAAAVHEAFVSRLGRLILEDRLGDLTARYTGQGPTPVLAEGSMLGFRAWEWLQRLLFEPDSPWFDRGQGETRDDIMRLALRQAVDHLREKLGPNPGDWAWGKLHTLTYSHTLGRAKPLDRIFNRGPYTLGGDFTTVCATGATPHPAPGNEGVIGPSYRLIVDLGDLRRSLGQLAPGQSGQPGSRHYDDQIQPWFRGEHHPMLLEREDVEREAEARLELRPG